MSTQKPGVGSSRSGWSIHPPKITPNSDRLLVRNNLDIRQMGGTMAVFFGRIKRVENTSVLPLNSPKKGFKEGEKWGGG